MGTGRKLKIMVATLGDAESVTRFLRDSGIEAEVIYNTAGQPFTVKFFPEDLQKVLDLGFRVEEP